MYTDYDVYLSVESLLCGMVICLSRVENIKGSKFVFSRII